MDDLKEFIEIAAFALSACLLIGLCIAVIFGPIIATLVWLFS